MAEASGGDKLIADNRKAVHDFHILNTFEAGLVLVGTKVKAIREGRVNLRDSLGRVEAGEIRVYNIHISSYTHRGYADHEPTRMYFENGRVKLAISLAKGKKARDTRETIRRRAAERETRAAIKERRR